LQNDLKWTDIFHFSSVHFTSVA